MRISDQAIKLMPESMINAACHFIHFLLAVSISGITLGVNKESKITKEVLSLGIINMYVFIACFGKKSSILLGSISVCIRGWGFRGQSLPSSSLSPPPSPFYPPVAALLPVFYHGNCAWHVSRGWENGSTD